ncbi:type IX secretion system sortase PorU [Flavobacterium sp.]
MKKIITLCILIMNAFSAISQEQGNISLKWTDKKAFSYGNRYYTIPHFNPESYHFDANTKTLDYFLNLQLNNSIDESALLLTNLTFESITDSQLGDLDPKNIPSSFKYSFENYKARDKYLGKIKITPIIKEGSGYKKLVSFSYAFGPNSRRTQPLRNNIMAIQNSVLSSGNWYRFYVKKSGVYKLSKSFLGSLGLNTNVDPRKIKIYGNGGRLLPLLNSEEYPMDLTENAIQFIGENDGVFDNQDYILFYAEGTDQWNNDYKSSLNIYSDKSYYYVTTQGGDGKRITDKVQPSGNATTNITAFDAYQIHEKEEINIEKSGRVWFGESFSVDNEQDFDFEFPNIVTTVPITIETHVAVETSVINSFQIEANGQPVGTITINPGTSGDFLGRESTLTASVPSSSADVNVKITYDNGEVPNSRGYLDFIRIKAKRELKGTGDQFLFQFDQGFSTVGIGEFQLTNASSISQVWDVTDIYNVTKVDNAGQQNGFSFKDSLGEVRKYIAVDMGDYYSPLKDSKSKVDNQNLKGTIFNDASGQFQDIDYLIITPKFLNAQAEKLATFHRNYSNLNVKVVNLETIYPEFSSGKQDIGAIRNFVKYVFFNASSEDRRVKYLNLFGDGSYDFKDRVPNNTNIVPIYQALDSYGEGESEFATDDFFGMMDPEEGRLDWGITPAVGATSFPYRFGGIDIAVGRMIVSTTQQAEEMVNKVIEYHDIKSYGSWRNNYVGISDDPASNIENLGDNQLQFYQNRLADRISTEKPFINVIKILMDSYQQETSAGGKRYPKAREEIFSTFEKGALVFNYLGHGGEDGLSEERIWEKSDGENLSNRYKYPLFITITCTFSRFDNPYRPTAGEYTYWNPKGGAISMITTIRSIGQSSAQYFNDDLARYLFSYGNTNYTSMAEALRIAKNYNPSPSTNIVCYLGDPAVMLAIAKPNVVLTAVNDVPITGAIDDFQSLDYIKLTGQVRDENNNPLPTYNGELAVNIFDKNIDALTLRNDNVDAVINEAGTPTVPRFPFARLGETIFRGNASVVNGNFEFGFYVPRDIRIPVGNGRISFYAKRNQILLDKAGVNTDIIVGGINTNAVADTEGPTVKLYMNDETFVNGGITNESPFLLAILEDEHGINTASGIGHDIIGILDGDETKQYVMNNYYEADVDNFARGRVYFPFRNLAVGLHTITFRAWDVYNNPIVAEIQFVVVGDESITLSHVLNYPNPFVSYTEFWFSHNRPFEPLDVQVQVMTITGKIVWSKNQTVTTDGFLSREITWDGKDDFGDRIGKGVYVYKLKVKSTLSNKTAEKIEKLVIL